jgi:hypothetical protein
LTGLPLATYILDMKNETPSTPTATLTKIKLALRRDSIAPIGQAAHLYVECCKTGDVRTIIWIDDELNTCATCGRTVDRSGWVVSSSSPETGR